jgi:hypothetical protein
VAASSAHVVELATAAAFTQTLTETAVHYLRVIDGLVGERNGTHASREDWMNETRIPSTNETRHPPTGWWAKLGGDDQIVTVPRWFWPPSTTVEVWDRHEREWDDRPIFLALHDEPSWQEVDEPAVQDWISAHKP